MKKIILAASIIFVSHSQVQACSWYDPDAEYFNLFTQSIIRDKSYTPFLLTYSNRFYHSKNVNIPDENIEDWRKYFKNVLSYQETEYLVKHLPLADLQNYKSGKAISDVLLKKLGQSFYTEFQEGFDYLIQAKYMQPYATIANSGAENNFYYGEQNNYKTAANLDYKKTIAALNSLYNAAKNPEIKLRYGYQIVRFNHYNHLYNDAVSAFKKYVEPLNLKTAPYYLALNQYAGALRGLEKTDEANWNFFQVFKNSKYNKENAYISMTLSDSTSFSNLLKKAETSGDKSMAYFLLGYQDFNNPLPMMEKMYEDDPKSEMLKVLAARAINEVERNFLPIYYYENANAETTNNTSNGTNSADEKKPEVKERSFWQKIGDFFSNIFSSKKEKTTERSENLSDKEYLNHNDRIPFLNAPQYDYYGEEHQLKAGYIDDLEKFIGKTKSKSDDEFWQITDAYIKFLKKDYEKSSDILNDIQSSNPEYNEQINRMKMLNDITSQPKITPEFEEKLFENYKEYFTQKEAPKQDSITEEYNYEDFMPTTGDFLKDILANRYFIQGEDAKSYLMNNKLSDFRYNPDFKMAQKLEAFFKKNNKTSFEKNIISANMDDVGSPDAFFNLVYGDYAMRNADFDKAKNYYQKAALFSGFAVNNEYYDYEKGEYVKISDTSELYDGYKNISSLIFGHNFWECYTCEPEKTMVAENFVSEFPFINKKMNKYELADVLSQLKKIGSGNGQSAANANQLIGNVMYNTSILGYFRETFVMDIDNTNGGKYDFVQQVSPFKYYYKNYSQNVFIKPDNFDLEINYYSKALQQTTDREQKARILFQMASAEQGKYYQWESSQPVIEWSDKDWEAKTNAREKADGLVKNQKYRTYFSQLKSEYQDTKTSKQLQTNCSYYSYFLSR